MRLAYSVVVLAILATSALAAQKALGDRTADQAAIREVVSGLTAAWDAGDGQAWAARFAEDAHFTVWFGLNLSGRESIAQGHDFIFHDFYAGTVLHLEVRTVRFLGANAAVVHMAGSVTDAGQLPPDEPSMVPLAVMKRRDEGWTIVAFQNTPFVVEQFRQHGDLRDFKAAVSSRAE